MNSGLKQNWLTILLVGILVILLSANIYKRIAVQDFKREKVEIAQKHRTDAFERCQMNKLRIEQDSERKASLAEQERDKVYREEIKQWMQGTWIWKGRLHVYGYQYMNVEYTLLIDGNNITAIANGNVIDQGEISDIDIDENIIHFGSHSNLEFNNNCKKIYTGTRKEGTSYHKISNGVSPSRSVTSGSSYSGSPSSDSRLMTKFNELNEEGRQLVSEIGQYYQTGQAGPWVITDVYRLKQIQDEKISLARQMGDRDLERLCLQQKVQTLTALRQMGF